MTTTIIQESVKLVLNIQVGIEIKWLDNLVLKKIFTQIRY